MSSPRSSPAWRLAAGTQVDAAHRDLLTILMLARHEETGEAMSDRQLRDDVTKLPRLKAVISETLRLYPPVWMLDRRALGPDDLGGTPVAKGDLVIFCPYAIHRLPELWRDPEAFRPERFEPGGEEQKNKFAYLPFSAGPRTCLGNSVAMIESQIIVGTLLSRFRTRLADASPVIPEPRVTLRTSRPVMLKLERAALA